MLIETALREKHDPKATVEAFGYFFPSVRTFGFRVHWEAATLAAGVSILNRLCSLIQDGAFVATNKADDYRDIRDLKGNEITGFAQIYDRREDMHYSLDGAFRKVPLHGFIDSPWSIFVAQTGKAVLAYKPEKGSVDNWEELKLTSDKSKRNQSTVSIKKRIGRPSKQPVSVLQAFAKHGPPTEPKPVAEHDDDDPTNDHAKNIRWGNASTNAKTSQRNKGKKKPNSIVDIPIRRSVAEQIKKKLGKKMMTHTFSAIEDAICRAFGIEQVG